ncbi:MAG: allophanate hydrolase subunit 2 family protein, partial [Pseudomonadota bacterium]|nr:allophanate hydrolase subunit 2 family protein [Pseudomonadota bacterium]
GSRATYVRAGMGGLEGRKLAAGDALPLLPPPLSGPERRIDRVVTDDPAAAIRVVLGPQDDYFTTESIAVFLSSHYEVTWQADRMGYRLEGPPLEHSRGFNIVSDAILPGSIQVPGNGRPIVLLRDAQTTGGYPKVATIISADLGRFAQLRPLSRMRFAAVTPAAAQLLRREFITRVQATGLRTRAA